MDDAEAQMMAKAYTEEKAEIAIATEQQELKSNNPLEKSYGLHCITGTIGAAIAKPIEHRLNQLKSLSFAITRFGKINFSGPEAGMRLQDNIDLSHTHFLEASQVIYHPSNQSYIQFFRDKQFKSIYVTGICGDICVQQAAEGLKEELPHTKMMVVDACTHYLVLPEKPYDATRTSVTSSYDKKGISVITVPNWRSNPDCASKLYPIDNTPPILACYMHYPNACNAIVAGLAVASVVVATALMLGTTPTAVVIVGAAIGFGAIGAGITFFNPLTLQRNVEHSSGCALSN